MCARARSITWRPNLNSISAAPSISMKWFAFENCFGPFLASSTILFPMLLRLSATISLSVARNTLVCRRCRYFLDGRHFLLLHLFPPWNCFIMSWYSAFVLYFFSRSYVWSRAERKMFVCLRQKPLSNFLLSIADWTIRSRTVAYLFSSTESIDFFFKSFFLF